MNEADEPLEQALTELRSAPPVFQPSPFWEKLARQGIEQLGESGWDNFKRTVNMRYFNWNLLGIAAHQALPMLQELVFRPTSQVLSATPSWPKAAHQGIYDCGPVGKKLYATYVALLWEHCRRIDKRDLLSRLEEPLQGNPLVVRHRDRTISQDLCNSVHELYSSLEDFPRAPAQIAELGAGYGRLAFAFLKAFPDSTYTIIDIPPALLVAQRYLKSVFPDEKIFHYRPFESFESVADEFASARIRFLLAPQISLLPNNFFDLFLNVSSLHEMTQEQIAFYIGEIGRLCRGWFYTKQWRRARNRGNNFVLTEHDYPIPSAWREVYHRRHPIQRMFFEALYALPEAAAAPQEIQLPSHV